ncbi:TPA: hypothetical protein IX023_002657 [Enterococcus faecium]|nr:hypothetical protein [Enterococcus faecium]
MTKFKSKGMQQCTYYYIGDDKRILEQLNEIGYPDKLVKQIGYYIPELRIDKESLEVLYDSGTLLVFLTTKSLICQFENN